MISILDSKFHKLVVAALITFVSFVVFAGTRVDDADALITTIPMPIMGVDNMDEAAKMVMPLSDIVDMAQKITIDVKFEVVRLYDIVDMTEKIAIDVKFEVIL